MVWLSGVGMPCRAPRAITWPAKKVDLGRASGEDVLMQALTMNFHHISCCMSAGVSQASEPGAVHRRTVSVRTAGR